MISVVPNSSSIRYVRTGDTNSFLLFYCGLFVVGNENLVMFVLNRKGRVLVHWRLY